MPLHRARDRHGPYYAYGYSGKRYYYISGNKKSRLIALNKSIQQMKAIEVNRK